MGRAKFPELLTLAKLFLELKEGLDLSLWEDDCWVGASSILFKFGYNIYFYVRLWIMLRL